MLEKDSSYLALVEENLDDCILFDMKDQWKQTRQKGCGDDFIAVALNDLLPG